MSIVHGGGRYEAVAYTFVDTIQGSCMFYILPWQSVPEIKALLVCWDRVVSGSDDNTQEPDNEDGSLPEKHGK